MKELYGYQLFDTSVIKHEISRDNPQNPNFITGDLYDVDLTNKTVRFKFDKIYILLLNNGFNLKEITNIYSILVNDRDDILSGKYNFTEFVNLFKIPGYIIDTSVSSYFTPIWGLKSNDNVTIPAPPPNQLILTSDDIKKTIYQYNQLNEKVSTQFNLILILSITAIMFVIIKD